MEKKSGLFTDFFDAVENFMATAKEVEVNPENGWKSKLMDAADKVFLERDKIKGEDYDAWNDVIQDIAYVSRILEHFDVVMAGEPQKTSTGKETYRILNKPGRNG